MTQKVEVEFPEIVARAGREYRIKRYILFIVLLGFGIACVRDGFFKWPQEQVDFNKASPERQAQMEKPHNDMSILIQKGLAILFLGFAPLSLAFTLYNSRGEIRLSANRLDAPGHAGVPVDCITELDKSKWDRKGIAYAKYDAPADARRGRIRLDDFIYQHEPVRAIVDRIEAELNPPASSDQTAGQANES